MSRISVAGSFKEGGFAVFDLTPHKVAVCHLIQLFAPPAQQTVPFPFESASQHNRLGLFLFSLTRACNDFVEPPLVELINQFKVIGDSVSGWLCDHLVSNLTELSSPDDLFNFFEKLRGVIATPDGVNMEDDQIFLDPNSHLGVFLRCCILSFNLLTFEGVCHLLTNISTYCSSADPELPEEDDLGESEFHDLLEDAEPYNEIDVFQKYKHAINATSPGESSASHIRAPRLISCSKDGNEAVFNRSSASPPDIYVGRYETALLCLGTMHCYFGHPKKALEALTEAVRFCQLSSDDACLAYTLAAICNLLSDVGISSTSGILGSQDSLETSMSLGAPLSTQQQLLVLLNRSLKRADSLKLISLMAFNRLALSKFDLKHVRRSLLCFGPKSSTMLRTCPVTVCKELRLSLNVLSEFGCDGLSLPNDDGAFSTSWIKNLTAASSPWFENIRKLRSSSVNDFDLFHFDSQPNPIPGSVLQLAGSSYLLRATSWELYGSAPLVRLNALVYATCFANGSSLMELSLAYVKLIQHLAVFKGYKEAFIALKLAEKKFLPASKSRIQLLKLQLLHEHALHRGQLKVAQRICNEIGVLASSTSGVDMDLKTEENLRHARTLLAANQYSKAAAVANMLFCMCYKFNMQVENATVLLLLAEIHKKSGNAVLALQYVLASLSFCQAFNLDLLEASGTLTLVELWLSLGSNHAKRALSLLHRVLPIILGHGGLLLRARANVTLAKCHLSDPTFLISEDPHIVLDPLNQAAEEHQILEYHEMAAEAFYLMAMIYNHLGQLEAREDAAGSFRKHITALENTQAEDDSLLYDI